MNISMLLVFYLLNLYFYFSFEFYFHFYSKFDYYLNIYSLLKAKLLIPFIYSNFIHLILHKILHHFNLSI